MGLLDGKVAVVTGAGRGIGREEALTLADQGARVIVNDLGAGLHGEGGADTHPAEEVAALIRQNGGEATVNGDDISTWAGGKSVVEQAVDTYGSLDILVNNAGILRDKMSFNMDESDWDDVIRVHLKGHFAATHHAAVYWRNRSKAGEEVSGRIVNTSSEAGLFGNAGQANYAAAKAGIAALTWVEARELSRYGVTANAIAPRARTRMTENIFGGAMATEETGFDAWDPRNIANVVAFLAAPSSADVNGQIFVVFGGNIYAMSAFKVAGQVTRDAAWTPEELVAAKSDLFKGISSDVPEFRFCSHRADRVPLLLAPVSSFALADHERARRADRLPEEEGAPSATLRLVTEQALGGDRTVLGDQDVAVVPGGGEEGTVGPGSDRAARLRRFWAAWRRPLTVAIGATIGFRLVVTWVALVSAHGVKFPHVVARHPSVLTQVLAQWDAGYYLSVAAHGYPAQAGPAAVQSAHRAFYAFGPLYPALVSLTHAVTRFGYVTSGEIVSTLGLVVALAALWKLVAGALGTQAADGACVLLLAWPSAFFLVATYPESVTLAAATLAFLAARRGHYVAAGLLAAAAAMGKYYLILLVVPLAMEVWAAPRARECWRAGRDLGWLTPWRVTAARAVAVVGPTMAVVVAWMAYQKAHFGEWLAFVHAQAQWHRHVSWPWSSLGHAVSDLVHWRLLDTSTASVAELFDLVTVLLLALAAVVAFVRIRPSYGVLLALAWCVFTFQTVLLSESREVLVLFPFFAAFGVWVARHPWRERALLFLFLPCAYFLLERFVTGRFAG